MTGSSAAVMAAMLPEAQADVHIHLLDHSRCLMCPTPSSPCQRQHQPLRSAAVHKHMFPKQHLLVQAHLAHLLRRREDHWGLRLLC